MSHFSCHPKTFPLLTVHVPASSEEQCWTQMTSSLLQMQRIQSLGKRASEISGAYWTKISSWISSTQKGNTLNSAESWLRPALSTSYPDITTYLYKNHHNNKKSQISAGFFGASARSWTEPRESGKETKPMHEVMTEEAAVLLPKPQAPQLHPNSCREEPGARGSLQLARCGASPKRGAARGPPPPAMGRACHASSRRRAASNRWIFLLSPRICRKGRLAWCGWD